MQVHVVTPTQKVWADARRERLQRMAPRPVVQTAAVMPVPEPLPEPPRSILSPEWFEQAWSILEPPNLANDRMAIGRIKREICSYYNITRIDLESKRRTVNLVRPRQIGMYLSKTLTKRSLPEIAALFGGRDHTTVLHGVRKIEKLIETNPKIAEDVIELKRRLGA